MADRLAEIETRLERETTAWNDDATDAEPDMRWLIEEVKRLRATLRTIRDVVDRQAEDEGLWFVSETAAEAYVQQQLRALHTDIERHTLALAST